MGKQEQVPKVGEKAQKKEQKAQTSLDKSVRKNEDILQHMKGDIQFLIQHRNTDNQEKQVKAAQVYASIEGILFQIAQTRIGGRVIQLVIKCADAKIKVQVFNKLLSDKQFPELLKSNYGHYIGITMIRNMINEAKKPFFEVMLKHCDSFVAQPDACVVLNRFLEKIATPSQVNQIKSQFQEPGEKLDNLAMKIIERQLHRHMLSLQILRIALPTMVRAEKDKVIQYFQEIEFVDYLNHKDGVNVFCLVVNESDKKIRKNILKNVQTYMIETQQHLNLKSQFYLSLMKLLHTIDDTKLTNKQILTTVKVDWINNQHSYQIIQSIFTGKTPQDLLLENANSLKDSATRLNELAHYIFPDVFAALQQVDIFQHTQIVSAFVKFIIQENKEEAFAWLEGITKELLTMNSKNIYSPEQTEYWILTNPNAQRLAKLLVLEQPTEGLYRDHLSDYQVKLSNLLLKNLQIVLNSKAIYLLIALLEQSQLSEKIKLDLHKYEKIVNNAPQSGGLTILRSLL